MLQSLPSLSPSSSLLDVPLWFTVLSDEASTSTNTTLTSADNTTLVWKEFYDYILQWEERASTSTSTSSASTASSRTTSNTATKNILYSVNDWMEYMERIDDMIITLQQSSSSPSSLSPPKTTITTTYITPRSDDDNPPKTHQKQQRLLKLVQQARDWVGCRAIMYLPRSYKLWKSIWEFHIQQFVMVHGVVGVTGTSPTSIHIRSSCYRVIQCFEQALLTLSHYPRVWIVYLQFVLQYPIPVTAVLLLLQQQKESNHIPTIPKAKITMFTSNSYSYHTYVRRILNQALQSLPLAQHDKLWSHSGIIDYCFQQNPYHDENHPINDENNYVEEEMDPENSSTTMNQKNNPCYYWPYPTMNRILCRYSQFLSSSGNTASTRSSSSSFPIEYATWCEKHQQYSSAAVAYIAILNSYNNNTTSNITSVTEGATATTTDTIMVGTSNNDQQNQQERDIVFQSLMELMAQHADTLTTTNDNNTNNHTAMTIIPWEIIVQTTIQNEIQLQQQEIRSQHDSDTATINPGSSNRSRFLGMLYTWYASAYIQRGEYDMARSIYEEGLLHVMTVRDFTILYTSYLSFLEGLIQVLYDNEDEESNDKNENDDRHSNTDNNDDWDLLLLDRDHKKNNMDDIEMAILRAEYLIQRRALLLNAVKLRQNPNDCAAYLERCELFLSNNNEHHTYQNEQQQLQVRPAIAILQDGLQRITNGGSSSINEKVMTSTAQVATISDLVFRLVQIFEETLRDVEAARKVFHSVCVQRTMALGIINADELAICWAKYIEFELKHEQYDTALSLSRQSISSNPITSRNKRNKKGTITPGSNVDTTASTTARSLNLTKSLRLWDLLLDLEESLGTVQTTKDAYNRAIEIKAATVHHILNFASYLMEHQYYEESFTAYERGIELFGYPHPGAKLLWKTYIDAFIKRYKGTKVERVRNLFTRCQEHCPASDCAEFYMIHGQFEEEYGLSKRALSVYKDMCEKVPVEDMYTAYQIFITKTIKHRGVSATRDIYQDGIEKLVKVHPTSVVKMCEDFAQMEVGLNQIDRARAIYVYGAQSADPRRLPAYWKGWNDFEIDYGNEDTFREMLRVKRSVEAAFSTINYNAIGMTQKISNFTNEEAMSMIAAAEGMEYNDTNNVSTTGTTVSGFVPATATAVSNKRSITTLGDVEERVAQLRKVTGVAESYNPTDPSETITDNNYIDDDEIDLDEIDAEIEAAAADGFNVIKS